jgi:hypothetical protein
VDRVRRMEDKTPKGAWDDRLAGTCYDWLAESAPRWNRKTATEDQ